MSNKKRQLPQIDNAVNNNNNGDGNIQQFTYYDSVVKPNIMKRRLPKDGEELLEQDENAVACDTQMTPN